MADTTPASTSPQPRRSGRRAIAAAVVAAVFLAAYVVGLVLYRSSQDRSGVAIASATQTQPFDGIEATVSTSTVDPVKGDLILRVQMHPTGKLVAADGLSLATPVTITVNSSVGKADFKYGAGERLNPFDATISLDGSGATNYPFDSYSAEFFMLSTEAPTKATGAASGGVSGSTTSTPAAADAAPTIVPVRVQFDGALGGYIIDANGLATAEMGDVDIAVSIKRAPVTILFSIFVLLLQVILALGATVVAASVLLGKRKPELPMLTWLAAMLFALIPLRNAMPGVPPIGVLIDVIVFLWAAGLIGLSLGAILVKWLLLPPPAK